jgi:DNA-binding Lrp family transcriptional regulator
MSDLLKILQETADPDSSKLAKILDLAEADVDKQLQELKESGALLGWVPLLHSSKASSSSVRAVIEVQDKPRKRRGL